MSEQPEQSAVSEEAPAVQQPTVGRIVHYVLQEADGAERVGEVRPAIVVRAGQGYINLLVFLDGVNDGCQVQYQHCDLWRPSVSHAPPHSGEGGAHVPGTWHWPPRV